MNMKNHFFPKLIINLKEILQKLENEESIESTNHRELLDKNLSEVGINAPVSFFIGISQCRLGNRLADAGVIQLARECSQTVFNVTETFPPSELSKTHDQKVLPTRKLPYSVVAIVLIDTLLELIFWQKLHQL